jgi:uncharacterized protein (DUF2147 family)
METTNQENVMRVLHLYGVWMVFVLEASPCLANDLSGTWLRDNGTMQVKFDRCGDARCGTIVWIKPGSETKQAMPGEDAVYTGKISMEGSTLTTAGCMAGGLICKSLIWKRVP